MSDKMQIDADDIAALARHSAAKGLSSLSFSSPRLSFDIRFSAPTADVAAISCETPAPATEPITAFMPGRIRFPETSPRAGDMVRQGEILVLLEAGGLRFPVVADASGSIVSVEVEDGDLTGYGCPLVTLRRDNPQGL